MSALKLIQALKYSTAETDQGPTADLRRDALVLRYDAEDNDGTVWTRLSFQPVLAVRFTADLSVQPWMIDAYSKVCEVDASSWIRELAADAREGRRSVERARHFVIYFDDVGCFEVAAHDVRVLVEERVIGDRGG